MARSGFAWLAVCVLAACKRPEPPAPPYVEAQGGEEFTLTPAAEATLTGAGNVSKVRFVGVTDDTRCLKGDTCPQSVIGTARVEVQAVKGESRHTVFLTFASRGAPEIPQAVPCIPFGDRTLRVTNVEPWPRSGKTPDSREYRASFLVKETCDYLAGAP